MNSNEPLLSVCLITYNHQAYIARAIESILKQKTDFEFELIIGEDASTDGTREICQGYAAQFPDKIKLHLRDRKDVIFHNGKPTGFYNMIKTLEAAKGRYIAIIEGDDCWTYEGKLQYQIDFLNQHAKASASFHDAFIQHGFVSLENVWEPLSSNAEEIINIEFGICKVLASGSVAPTASMVLRREVLLPINQWYGAFPSDWKIELLSTLKGQLIMHNVSWSVYTIHGGGVWSGLEVLAQTKNRIELVDRILEHKELAAYTNCADQYRAVTYERAYKALMDSDKLKSLDYLLKFIRYSQINLVVKAKHFIKTALQILLK